jgi:hypothetical protein
MLAFPVGFGLLIYHQLVLLIGTLRDRHLESTPP